MVDARAVVESGLRSGRKHASVQVTEKGQGSFMKDTRATAKGNNRSPRHKPQMDITEQTHSNFESSNSNISENVVPKETINNVVSFDSNPSFVHVNK